MNIKIFRILVIAYITTTIASPIFHITLLPELGPEANRMIDEIDVKNSNSWILVFDIAYYITWIFTALGMLYFWNSARYTLSFLVAVNIFSNVLFSGMLIDHAISASIYYVNSLLEGAILGIAFTSNIQNQFLHQNSERGQARMALR